jgi:hypothetical protein
MTLIQTIAKQSLKEKGLEGFGLTMPVMSPKWLDVAQADPAVIFDEDNLMLTSDEDWVSPFPGQLVKVDTGDNPIGVSLQKADGSMVNESGALLTLFPQSILRLKRLLAIKTETENTHTPGRSDGKVIRPVPAYVFFGGNVADSFVSGSIYAGLSTGISGNLSFFDEQGHIIHPLFVASMFRILLNEYQALKVGGSPDDQLDHLIGLAAAANMVRLIQTDGTPYGGEHLEGVSSKNANSGLFTLDSPGDDATDLVGEIKRADATDDNGDFPEKKAKMLLIGNTAYGRMLDKVSLPKNEIDSSADPNWPHDFFTVLVMDLSTYLTGTPNPDFNGTKFEQKPEVRLNQNLSLLTQGNAFLGHVQAVLSGSPTQSFVVAPSFETQLNLPADPSAVLWPDFPALPSTLTATADSVGFPADFKNQIQDHGQAQFISATTQPTDVLLSLTGLPTGAAVRVFNRKFGEEAKLSRGDGAGGVVVSEASAAAGRTFNGQVNLVLKDPLGLKRPDGTITVPTEPVLIFDLMVVYQNPVRKRLFGAITIPISDPEVSAPPPGPVNSMDSAALKGVCNAPIMGLTHPNPGTFDFSNFQNFLNSALVFMGETQPRDASRLPTMARREILIASQKSSGWEAALSGGVLDGSLHNAQQDLGCPGSPGGKENANSGVLLKGQLAYDAGRMAFRRTTSFYDRIAPLADSTWDPPASPDALGPGDDASDASGLFAGAILQNVSPFCETPELALLKSILEPHLESLPESPSAFIDDLIQRIDNYNPDTSSWPELLQNGVTELKTLLMDKINEIRTNSSADLDRLDRSYFEIKRELSSAFYGRRDSQWAIEKGISTARKFIYLETPGFNFTQGSTGQNYSLDLIDQLKTKLTDNPGLKLILCIPKEPDYSRSYEQWKKLEVKKRYELLQQFPAKQTVVFHPIGFPGRPSNISTTTLIVDDCWALIGSSAFRRRGLVFDGSVDLVLSGLERNSGKNPEISNLRKALLAQRLGIDFSDKTNTRTILLEDFGTTFKMIRESLVVGGLGKIERLWNGRTSGVAYQEPTINENLANPDGLEFNTLEAMVYTAFTGLAK